MMWQFLKKNIRDDVFTTGRRPELKKGEAIQKYANKFWNLYLKATEFEEISFLEQRQQYCVGLPDDVRLYINSKNLEAYKR